MTERTDRGSAGDEGRTRLDEVASKLAALRALLDRRGLGAAALSARRNVAWLTAGADTHVVRAGEGGVVTLLVTPDDVVALTAVNEAARIREEELAGLGIEVVPLPWEDPGAIAREIAGRVGVGLADDRTVAGGEIADDASLEDDLRHLRSRLSDAELERLAAIGAEAARAMTDVFEPARPGETDAVVAARLATALAAGGMAAPVLLAASDERIVRYRHPIPKPKQIERSLMLVVVAERGGLHAAVTRMGWLRGRPDDETVARYRACARIDAALREATVPGRSLSEILAAGVAAYAAAGYPDEWRLHHQGGTIGYAPRETIATPTASEIAEGGMAFAFNPSITGAKAEETFVLRGDGSRRIVTRDARWPAEDDGTPAIRTPG
jgi:Xaa-Pro dipeptidase